MLNYFKLVLFQINNGRHLFCVTKKLACLRFTARFGKFLYICDGILLIRITSLLTYIGSKTLINVVTGEFFDWHEYMIGGIKVMNIIKHMNKFNIGFLSFLF